MEKGIEYIFEEEKAQYGFLECVNTESGPSFEFIDTSISRRDALTSSYPNSEMFGGKKTKKQNKKRNYSRKHRGGGGQCSSLGCKDNEIPDSDKIVMANDFLNNNINNYDYTKTNNKNKEVYLSVLHKIQAHFTEGIDGNTKLVEAFKQPKNPKNASTFSSNCNMFRDNLLDRLKSGYMEELKGKDILIVVLSDVERKLITQESKGNFKKEFNENKAAAEEKEMQRLEMQRLEKERQRLEKERQDQEKKRQTAKNINPFTQNRKTDRDTRRNIIENKFGVVLSTAHNKSQNSSQPPK
jgi:hypothetical protein